MKHLLLIKILQVVSGTCSVADMFLIGHGNSFLPKKRRLFVPKMVPKFQSKLPNVQISTLRVEVISLRRIDGVGFIGNAENGDWKIVEDRKID